MAQPSDGRSPSDLVDKNFFIPGRLRYPTPLRPLSPSSAAPTPSPPSPVASPSTALPRPGEVTPDKANGLQTVSKATVTIAKQDAGADVELVSGTPDVGAVGTDGNGQQAEVVVDSAVDGDMEGTSGARGAVKSESGVLIEGQEHVEESMNVQPTATTVNYPSSARAPHHCAISGLDGTRDDMVSYHDLEAQRDGDGNRAAEKPSTQKPQRIILILSTIVQSIFTFLTLSDSIGLPRPPLTQNTYSIEFVFLAEGIIVVALLLILRDIPRIFHLFRGTYDYIKFMLGKDGKMRGLWLDVAGEVVIVGCLGVVLGLKVSARARKGEQSCLKGLDEEMANGWRWGDVNCNRLDTIVRVLGMNM